jgi:hypothetical protein
LGGIETLATLTLDGQLGFVVGAQPFRKNSGKNCTGKKLYHLESRGFESLWLTRGPHSKRPKYPRSLRPKPHLGQ